MDRIARTARHTLHYLDDPHPVDGKLPDRDALRAKLGWLNDHREALAEVKIQDVLTWRQEHLGISVQSQRRQALAGYGKLLSPAILSSPGLG